MFLKVNHFATAKGKSLLCKIFIKAEMIRLHMYAKFHIIRFQIIFYTVLKYNSFL